MKRATLSLLAILAFAAAAPAGAALYKCAGDKGGVVYQDKACPPGKELRDLEADPPTLSVVPGTPVPVAEPRRKPPRSSSGPDARQSSLRPTALRAKGGDAANRRFIRVGMSEGEVIMRIGRADFQTKGHGKSGQRWSYFPAAGDADTVTTITLAGGKVVDVERRVAR
jgi:hypothetical protein